MIIITGAAGFIGSCMVAHLNQMGYTNLILVDDFSRTDKQPNWQNKHYHTCIERNNFIAWLPKHYNQIKMLIHLGARTDTTETNVAIFDQLNLHYTQQVWALCTQFGIPLLYASSAATYGNGEHGYIDSHQVVPQLQPLNPYGRSKNDFDAWALQQTQTPPLWYGVKFFNVYGPNEYHKGRMASVIMHGFNQIKQTGGLKLFKSHRPDFANGQQLRDFIYVKDVVSICWHLLQTHPESGLYNVGTGKANSFLHLAESTFAAMNLSPNIEFIDIPADIRNTYQYFTEANTAKLLSTGYNTPFYSLADGITAYVQMYLTEGRYW